MNETNGQQGPTLARRIGPVLLTLYGVGTTIGAGIYVLIGAVADQAGAWTAYAFLLASVLAGLTALSFAELSARMPKSAGEALYVREAFSSGRLALIVGLLVAAAGTVSAASIVVGSIGYIQGFVDAPSWIIAVVLCLGLGGLAGWGIRESTTAAAVLTVIEIGGLALVIWAGTTAEITEGLPVSDIVWPHDPLPVVGLFAGAVLAFYAFIGFEDIVNVAEEVVRPARTMAIAIVGTLVVAGVLYLAVALVALIVVPIADLSESRAPLALVFERSGGNPHLLAGIAVLATVNGVLVQMVMASRVLFGLSRQGGLPAWLGAVNATTRTPLTATVLVVAAILALALFYPIATLAGTTSLITLTVFALCNLALWRLKKMRPPPEGAINLPVWLPILGALVSGTVLALELIRRFAG